VLTTVTDAEGDEEAGGASAAAAMPQRAKKARLDMRNSRTIFIRFFPLSVCWLMAGSVFRGPATLCIAGVSPEMEGAPISSDAGLHRGARRRPDPRKARALAAPETVFCPCASHTWTE